MKENHEKEEGKWRKMVRSCEETIALEESVENSRKIEETVGMMRKWQEGHVGKTRRKTVGKQRPLGFGPSQFGFGDEQGYQGVPKECKQWRRRSKHVKTLCTYNTIITYNTVHI